ncbi:MAG: ABC transporter permease [Xanthomonadales bacterium]|nr:ABC transporter permease [Xanthomonadales bacterium]
MATPRPELSAIATARTILRHRKILLSVTRVELAKRYSGSAFGLAWVFLYPALLLSIYLFVYLVIFKMRFPGYSEMDYTLYVFCGLIPYMGFMESVTAGAMSIKQNIHLIRNVMLPIELIPVRAVAVGLASQSVALVILFALALSNNSLSIHILWLPLVIMLQMLLLIGIVLVVSALAVALPDVSYFVNLGVLLLMFISPIGFKPDMVPAGFAPLIYLNPVHYMTDAFRSSILANHVIDMTNLGIYALICISTFALGAAFFRRFKYALMDHE